MDVSLLIEPPDRYAGLDNESWRTLTARRKDLRQLFFRVEDEHSAVKPDRYGYRLASGYRTSAQAQVAVRQCEEGKVKMQRGSFSFLKHFEWDSRVPTPFISCSYSPGWAVCEAFGRLSRPRTRKRRLEKLRIVVVDATYLERWVDAWELLYDKGAKGESEEVGDKGQSLRKAQSCARSVQEVVVYGFIPRRAVLSTVHLSDPTFRQALETLWQGITTKKASAGDSFRQMLLHQYGLWTSALSGVMSSDARTARHMRDICTVDQVELGQRAANLAIAMLPDQWNRSWTDLPLESRYPKLDNLGKLTRDLAVLILLDRFDFEPAASEIDRGICERIQRRKEECAVGWPYREEAYLSDDDTNLSDDEELLSPEQVVRSPIEVTLSADDHALVSAFIRVLLGSRDIDDS